jgi:hypothetical protein
VESSCKLGNEPSGSIKCWELPNGCTTCGVSSGTYLHRVSYVHLNTEAKCLLVSRTHFWKISSTIEGSRMPLEEYIMVRYSMNDK